MDSLHCSASQLPRVETRMASPLLEEAGTMEGEKPGTRHCSASQLPGTMASPLLEETVTMECENRPVVFKTNYLYPIIPRGKNSRMSLPRRGSTVVTALAVVHMIDGSGREQFVSAEVVDFDGSFSDEAGAGSQEEGSNPGELQSTNSLLDVQTVSSMTTSFDKDDLYRYLLESKAVKITESRLKAQSGAISGGEVELKKWENLQQNVQTILITPSLQMIPFPMLVNFLNEFSTVDQNSSNTIDVAELAKVLQSQSEIEAQRIIVGIQSLFLPGGPLAQVFSGVPGNSKSGQHLINPSDQKLSPVEFCSACEFLRMLTDNFRNDLQGTQSGAESSFVEMGLEPGSAAMLALGKGLAHACTPGQSGTGRGLLPPAIIAADEIRQWRERRQEAGASSAGGSSSSGSPSSTPESSPTAKSGASEVSLPQA